MGKIFLAEKRVHHKTGCRHAVHEQATYHWPDVTCKFCLRHAPTRELAIPKIRRKPRTVKLY